MIKVSPSILAADPLHMGRDVQRMIDAGCDMIHVDIMDAHFVPNLSYSPALLKALHAAFDTVWDVHLMMDNPEKYADEFIACGADILTRCVAVTELPVSIFTSLLGAPFLIFLIVRGRKMR